MDKADIPSATDSVVIEARAVSISLDAPIPRELLRQFGQATGLYEPPEQPATAQASAR